MKYFLTVVLITISFSSFSQTEIKIDKVKDHIGDSVKIMTNIYGGKYFENIKGKPTFLNAGGMYPNAPLTLVIWGDVRSKFKTAPEEMYKRNMVWITGRVVLYKDNPEIVITDPGQLVQVVAAPIERK